MDQQLIEAMDSVHLCISALQRELFQLIVKADGNGSWEELGAGDLAHWLCMRYGVSEWKARRWIAAAHALEHLPRLSEAFSSGELGIDKVVELARFAIPETEADLVQWAKRVSGSWIRRKADLEERRMAEETRQAEQERNIDWYFSGDRFHLELDAPRADGARIVKRIRATAERVPVLPGEEDRGGARAADAAVILLTSAEGVATGGATVVIHARLNELADPDGAAELEGGPIAAVTARRMLCHSRFQLLLENDRGEPLKLGRTRRDPSVAMVRLLRYRDHGCVFPSCGASRYSEAHHIRWWDEGGPTDLESLALVCSFHHKLVHEFGWRIQRREGEIRWFRPSGARYRAGPAPPPDRPERRATAVIAELPWAG